MSRGDSPSPEVAARLRAAEARLYPIVLADPDMFERATSLVALVAAELRSIRGSAEVLGRLDDVLTRMPEVAAAAGIDVSGLPLDVVADAAAAVRCRELEAERAVAAVRDRIEAARAEGRSWLVEDAPMAMLAAGIQRRRELHVPSGATIVTTVELSGEGSDATYSLDLIPGDSSQGVVAQSRTFVDRAEWLAAADGVRALLEGRS